MHPHDGPQLDLSAQVAKVKEKARPWKSILALTLAIAAAAFSTWARYDKSVLRGNAIHDIVAAAAAGIFCVFGCIATYGLSGQVRNGLEERAGRSHAAVVRYFLLLIGAFATLAFTLELFGVSAGQLVLGGALTTVFVSIAAQQALGNVFAGIVLLLARPFRVGDNIRLRAGALGGQMDGIVTDIGITYVRLETGGSVMSVPNSQVLNAVVGPVPAPPQPAEEPAAPAAMTPRETPKPNQQGIATPHDGVSVPGATGPRPPGEDKR